MILSKKQIEDPAQSIDSIHLVQRVRAVRPVQSKIDTREEKERGEEQQDTAVLSSELSVTPDAKFTQLEIKDGKLVLCNQNKNDKTYFTTGGEVIDNSSEIIDISKEVNSRDFLEQLKEKSNDNIDIIRSLNDLYQQYIYFRDERNYSLVSIFTLLSYSANLFSSIPYLHVRGKKGAAKTTLIYLMQKLLHNPLICNDITPAALFRLVHTLQPTLIIDEADRLNSKSSSTQQLIEILNSGYKKGAKIPRVNKNGDVDLYNTYSPKILSGINELYPTLSDRCIQIVMQEASAEVAATLNIFTTDRFPADGIAEQILCALSTKAEEISTLLNNPTQLQINPTIINRMREKWFPILLFARVFSSKQENYFDQMQDLALLSLEKQREVESKSPESMCAGIIRDFVITNQSGSLIPNDPRNLYFRTGEILDFVREHDVYNFYRNKSELTQLLGRINIKSERRRIGGEVTSLYKIPASFIAQHN